MLASTNTARAKARDVQKTSDARQISTAMEMYYGDNKTIPPSLTALVPKYISKVPEGFTYATSSSGDVAVAYTNYETKDIAPGKDQQVGAVLVEDSSSTDLCALGLGFPTCAGGEVLDQVVNVDNGETISPQSPASCTSPKILFSDGVSCVCPSTMTDDGNGGCKISQLSGFGGSGSTTTCPYLQWHNFSGLCVPASGPFLTCGLEGYSSAHMCLCKNGFSTTTNNCIPDLSCSTDERLSDDGLSCVCQSGLERDSNNICVPIPPVVQVPPVQAPIQQVGGTGESW